MTLALILGSAACVWDDLAVAKELIGDRAHVVIIANYTGIKYAGDIDAWVTLHPDLMNNWQDQREALGFNTDYRSFTHENRRNVRAEIVRERYQGSSGLYAAHVGFRAFGASGVILCGVPMDADAGHIIRAGQWGPVAKYRPAFEQAKADGLNIRSMSGWSGALFGAPDADWIASMNLPKLVNRPRERKGRPLEMHVLFLRDCNFIPPENRRAAVAYKKGMKLTIKKAWAEKMIAEGFCEKAPTPKRPS